MADDCERLARAVGREEIPALIELMGRCIADVGNRVGGLIGDVTQAISGLLGDIQTDNDTTRDEIVAGVNRDIATSQGVITGAINQSEQNVKTAISQSEQRVRGDISGIQSGVNTRIGQAETSIGNAINASEGRLDQSIGQTRRDISDARGAIQQDISNAVTTLDTRIGSAENNIVSRVSGALNSALGGLGGAIGDLGSLINSAISSLSTTLSATVNALGTFIGDAIAASSAAVGAVVSAAQGFIDRLIKSLKEAWTRAGDFLRDLPGETVKLVQEWVGPIFDEWLADAQRGADYVNGKVSRLLRCGYGSFDAFVADMSDVPGGPTIARLITNALIGAGVVLAGAPTAAGPYLECIANMARADALSTNVDPNVIGLLVTRGIIGADRANAEASRLGLTSERMALYSASQQPVVDMGAIIRANYLQIINDREAEGFAARIGFSQADYQLQKAAAKSLLDPSRIVQAVFRQAWSQEQGQTELEKHGLSNEQVNALVATNRPFIDRLELRDAYLREMIGEQEHDSVLSSMGFTAQDAILIRSLYFFIPPPSDLIRMAVRDVFSPDIAQRFGLFDEFPEQFASWAKRQGISEEWARNYWGAHWALPSPQQGFAMFQRRIISNDELRDLLKAQDLTPFWRDRMRDLAFNPLTRVDTRRMYETGVIGEQEVFESYLDQGYSPENAKRLTEFTKRYNVADEESTVVETRALTRSVIERAYKRNLLTREQAIQELIELRYERETSELLLRIVDYDNGEGATAKAREELIDDTITLIKRAYRDRAMGRSEASQQLSQLGFTTLEADMMLSVIDYQITAERKEVITGLLRRAYIEHTIDMNEAVDLLSRNDFTASEAQELLSFWQVLRSIRVRKLTLSQLTNAVRNGIISVADLVGEMRGEGYNDRHIHTYTKMVFGETTGGGIGEF